jgi:hypothetical protein
VWRKPAVPPERIRCHGKKMAQTDGKTRFAGEKRRFSYQNQVFAYLKSLSKDKKKPLLPCKRSLLIRETVLLGGKLMRPLGFQP